VPVPVPMPDLSADVLGMKSPLGAGSPAGYLPSQAALSLWSARSSGATSLLA